MKKWVIGICLLLIVGCLAYYIWPEQPLPANRKIDKIVVKKSQRIMNVYSGDEIIKTYKIALGKNPVGDKEFEGDKRTPEGTYTINDKNANSGYHKNLGISYPNQADIEAAKQKGLKPGGQIKIHGLTNGLGFIGKFQRMRDWTAGCIALTDTEVDELYTNVAIGTTIVIEP